MNMECVGCDNLIDNECVKSNDEYCSIASDKKDWNDEHYGEDCASR